MFMIAYNYGKLHRGVMQVLLLCEFIYCLAFKNVYLTVIRKSTMETMF